MTSLLPSPQPSNPPSDSSPPINPPESQPSPTQPPVSPTVDLEPQPPPSQVDREPQPPPSQSPPSPASNIGTSKLVNAMVPGQGLEWRNIIMAFCFTSALDIALQFAQPHSQIPVSFHFLSFAILLIFAPLLVSLFMGKKFPIASKRLENAAILLAVTAFFYTIAIPFPLSLKCATWTIYAICLLTIVICNCFY